MRGNGFAFCSRISVVAMLLGCQLASAGNHGPQAREALRSEIGISTEDLAALGSVATRSPCAVLALLHILANAQSQGEGEIHMDERPGLDKVLGVLREFEVDRESALAAGLQRNPYSSAVAFVRIRWWTQFHSSRDALITFHAEYVDRAGAPVYPGHLMEPAMIAEITDQAVRVFTDEGPGRWTTSRPALPSGS